MYLKAIGAHNFMGYKDLRLEVQPGLTVIDGINHNYATASSNGAGKSSLPEVISVCSFGRTVRPLPIDKTIHRGKDWSLVWNEYVFDDSSTMRIERYRKHPRYGSDVRVAMNGNYKTIGRYKKDTNKVIVSKLGFDFDLFSRAILVHSRMTEGFVSVNDRYLKMITEKLIGLPSFDALLSRVKDTAAGTAHDIESLDDKIDYAKQTIVDARQHIENLKTKSAEFETRRRKQQREYKQQIAEIKDNIRYAEGKQRTYEKRLSRLSQEIHDINNHCMAAKFKLETAASREQKVSKRVTYASLTLMNKTRQRDKYASMQEGATCPECGQTITRKHLREKLEEHENEVAELRKTYATVREENNKRKEALKLAQDKVYKIENDSRKLADMKAGYKSSLEAARRDVVTYNRVLVKIRKLHREEENPYEKQIKDETESVAKRKRDIEHYTDRRSKSKRKLLYYEFWRKGFGPDGIRSYVLDAITPTLNRNANIYLDALTDGNMFVRLSTVTQKQDGSYRDKFCVEVDNLSGSDVLEGDSDGELGTLDLAVNLAMSDILETRIPGGFGFMFVDQAIDLLDTARGKGAIQLLRNKLDPGWCEKNQVPCKRSIWLVTHREALKGLVGQTILIEKRKRICSITSVE